MNCAIFALFRPDAEVGTAQAATVAEMISVRRRLEFKLLPLALHSLYVSTG
jgi:hypothetical protein